MINYHNVNVIYYSTFKKYNFKKSKLTLSLSIFEVGIYIWQHAKLWLRKNSDFDHIFLFCLPVLTWRLGPLTFVGCSHGWPLTGNCYAHSVERNSVSKSEIVRYYQYCFSLTHLLPDVYKIFLFKTVFLIELNQLHII